MSAYYTDNAADFFRSTVEVDMAPIYEKFLPLVPRQGHILDAGCGSGRDSRHFLNTGFNVTAFDASGELCKLASAYTGLPVQCLRFEDLDWQEEFDAVWACASLLHVARADLKDALDRLTAAMKPGAVLYASFKYGTTERQKDDRHFTDLDELGLATVTAENGSLQIIECWVTEDRRPNRQETWLNALLRKTNPV